MQRVDETLEQRQVAAGESPRFAGVGLAAPASPLSRRSPAPPRVAPRRLARGPLSLQRSLLSERAASAAPAWSGGEVRRFPRRLFRRRRRQSWEEAVEAGGSPRSGRRLEAAHRVPARINDLTGRRSRAASRVAWVGGERGARGPGAGPKGRSLPRRSEEKAEEREPRRRSRGACGGKGSSGPGRASAGRRLSRRRLSAPAAAATGEIKLCGG
ncbi:serine/arginine repetitive matrix protein 3 isoform X1 [Physeter macrocephalus]|uniref:ADP-ribosylation factor 6 isoform X1 n=1 Tax=Physeter macrocephalus TaxID=9755 RepID=A0A2Y9EPD5_PHYMC|nr:ADP-ribosylation factor 6 isoform X1 [Physeter catodon]XP_028336391.1 serine/arginine repetitive matrix protein 3 isoform X1 [Physeter catodon]|eukprot:XP_007105770.1 ADP-ribosylation factor 6 isoform X1 [Physeter catodon]